MQKRYLTLLIATALLTTACSKEKTAAPKAKEVDTAVYEQQLNEQARKLEALEAQLRAQQQQTAPRLAEPAPVVQAPAPAPAPVAPIAQVTPAHQAPNQMACHATTDAEIAALFDRWNASLKTGKADIVAANYAPDSILLPTVSNRVRHTLAEKQDYFVHFLENEPVGQINERYIKVGCNTAVDAGTYTFHFNKTGKDVAARYSFTYEWNGDKWLITSHHSSGMPEPTSASENKESVH